MDQKTLHTNKPEKVAYDNPGLILGSKTSLAPPPYSEGKSYSKEKEALSNVYVVPRNAEKPPKEDHYEPYDNRKVKHATTFSETLFHMLKASLGTGILAMPNAFHNAGYMVGTIGTLVIGFLCTYSIHILISAEYELCRRRKKPSMTYPETLEAALLEGPQPLRRLAPYADFVCNLFLMLYQVGSCCIYYVFVASNIKAVADEYVEPIDVRIYMCFLLIPFILINCIRNLKLLAPFSTAANFVTVISFAIIAYYMLTDIPSLDQRAAVASFKGMPLFFGTVLFAMEAIGVVMPLENEMDRPERFGNMFGVLNCAMLPITILYTLVGFFGYLKYGQGAQGSVTLNLPNDHLLAQSAKLMLAAAIFITHGLACYVAFDIIWHQKLKPKVTGNKLVWEYVTRTVLVLITFLFAVAIPNLELFISLIGAFCLSTMGLSFPALIQMLTFWDFYRGFGKLLFFLKNFVVVLIAILGFTIGVTTSVHEIYLKFFA
ncbi:proton-coupled amino acid transporter-like protein CG1139 [Macrosteles quadrilineatus]|nr:proton-coupled amino acid transporter-like protein CG1139 [Macrosteles quadrilineatus]XP_054276303.1 proton-coupled amino acid transporter-like protein CG1139 [Macrosteles quadrilineatus]